MSHTASGWQEGPLLEWCYSVFSVCGCVDEQERRIEREKERERDAEGAYWFQCAVACAGRTGGAFC